MIDLFTKKSKTCPSDLSYDSARVKASRLQRDHLIVRIDETVGGPTKAKYKKTSTIMI